MQAISDASIEKVTCQTELTTALEKKVFLKDFLKKATEKLAPVKKAAYDAWQKVCELERSITGPADKELKRLDVMTSKYLSDEQLRRDEEQRKAQEQADREAEEAREAERHRLWKEGKRKEAQAVAIAPLAVAPVPKEAAPIIPEELSVRQGFGFEITKPEDVPEEFLLPPMERVNIKVVRAYVNAQGLRAAKPWLRVFPTTTTARRGKR